MNMFSYYITTHFITSNKNYNSCRNSHSVYQTYPNFNDPRWFISFQLHYWTRRCSQSYEGSFLNLQFNKPHLSYNNRASKLLVELDRRVLLHRHLEQQLCSGTKACNQRDHISWTNC